jgi:hypothetical protein
MFMFFARVYTSTDKKQVLDSGHKNYLSSTYLSRSFRPETSLIFAPMSMEDIIEQLNWVTDKLEPDEALRLKCESALREFFHHGRNVFNEWKLKINDELSTLGIPTVKYTYDTLLSNYLRTSMKIDPPKINHDSPTSVSSIDPYDVTLYAQGYSSLADAFYGVFGFKPAMNVESYQLGFKAEIRPFGETFRGYGSTKKEAIEKAFRTFGANTEVLDRSGDSYESYNKFTHAIGLDIDGIHWCNKKRVIVPPPQRDDDYAHTNIPTLETGFVKPPSAWKKEEDEVVQPIARPSQPIVLSATRPRLFDLKKQNPEQYKRIEEVKKQMKECRKKLKQLEKELEDIMLAQGDSSSGANTKDTSAEIEVAELTQTRDIEETAVEPERNIRMQPYYVGTDPYSTPSMDGVLSRLYRIAEVTWNGGDTQNTIKLALNFPFALVTASTNLQEKLSYYNYFRSDVELEFKINSTPFHFGMLIGSWLPSNAFTPTSSYTVGSNKTQNIYSMSSSNCFFISANNMKSVKVTIPYISPQQYASAAQVSTNAGYFGSVYLRVLNPLKLIGSTATPVVNVSVFARFVNPEVAGPTLNQVTLSIKQENKKLREIIDGGWTGQGKTERLAPKNPEQEKKSKQGVVSNALGTIGSLASTTAASGLAGPYSGVVSAVSLGANLLGGVASMFGYNKPLNLSAQQPVQLSLLSGVNQGSGLLTTSDLALIPENATGNKPDIYGCTVDNHQLVNLFTKPGLFDTWTFDDTAAVGSVIKSYWVCPTTCATNLGTTYYRQYHVPLSMIAYNFSRWRGSIKYFMQIVCSQYTVGRIRITWHPTHSEIPSTYTEGEGDVISIVVDFRGDTTVAFTVPFLSTNGYLPITDTWVKGDQYSNGGLAISIVNAVTSSTSTGDSTVAVNMFIAGDKDFDFVQPVERTVRTGIPRTVAVGLTDFPLTGWVAQGSSPDQSQILDEIFQADFPTIIPAHTSVNAFVYEGEKVRDILTMMHRFIQPISPFTFTSSWTSLSMDYLVASSRQDTLYNLFSSWFMYSKGSFNWKIVRDYNAVNSPQGIIQATISMWNPAISNYDSPATLSNTYGRNGTIMEDTTYKPSMEFRQHWLNTTPFVESIDTRLCSHWDSTPAFRFLTYDGTLAGSIPVSLWFALGDDYSFGWPVGCPVLLG